MPRVQYVNFITDSYGQGVLGVNCSVLPAVAGTQTAVYTAATGTTRLATPIVTGSDGKVEFWLDAPVSYRISFTGSGFTNYTHYYEAVHSANVGGVSPTTMTNPMTTSGDMIYGGTSGAVTRLARGADGLVLMTVGGLPKWSYLATPISGGGGGSQMENWTDLGNLGTTETINGTDNSLVRRKGTLDAASTVTLSLAANQQLDLLLSQDSTGGRAVTFSGVNTWFTQNGAAPSISSRSALAVDRFYFENVQGIVYGYWLTEPVSSGGGGTSLTIQDEGVNVATGVSQIDFQGLNVIATAGSGEVIVTTKNEIPYTVKTGSYTLALADVGTNVEINSASAATVTVPTTATVAIPSGAIIEITPTGAGTVTAKLTLPVLLPALFREWVQLVYESVRQ
jgi:hypothetical protein